MFIMFILIQKCSLLSIVFGLFIIDINAGVKDDAEDLNGAAVAGNYFHNLQGGIWRPWA